ncbi:MAG: copper resistance protein CopC [Acidobacteria bacterium]|nr:copper resistance protein CopC [Acidobacteriota bacterium]
MLAGLMLLATATAFGHAKLLRSEPKAGASLDTPPRLVELWFSTDLSPGFSAIEVTDAGGRRADRGEVAHPEGKKAQVELGELAAGAYTVVWKVVSADEHTIRGKFTFKVAVGAATPTPSPAAATQATPTPGGTELRNQPAPAGAGEGEQSEVASSGESTITWLDNLLRWLAYLAMMTLFGGFTTRLFVLGPAFAGADGADDDGAAAAARRTVTLLRAAVVILLPTLLAALVLQSSSVNGVGAAEALSPALLGRVITGTGYGTAWLITMIAAAVVAAVAFLLGKGSHARGRRGMWWAGLLASAVMFVGPSLTGHAMAAAGQHHFAVVSDWLHLAAGGFWVGGLFHLALAAPAALARLGPAERGRAVGRVIRLFTRVAMPSVVVVSLAGLYSSWIHLGGLGALWGTAYGRVLLVKLLLVAPMLVLGAVNGFRYGPRAARLAGAGDDEGRASVERGFLRSVKIEAALGVLVLLAAAVLVFVTPGRNDALEAGAGSAEQHRPEGRGR